MAVGKYRREIGSVTAHGKSITVMMPKIARKTLGLADGSFSHISVDYHGLVFHGEGITRPVVLPVSMLGTFESDILNNLFLYLANNRQNGILALTTGPLTKSVFFKDGAIVFAGSTDATERIGLVLQRLGYVTEEQVRKVEEHPDPRRFGVRLRDAGYLTHRQLWDGLRVQVCNICGSLVDFPVGMFFFLPNAVPGDSFNHFRIEPTEMLFKGMIEMDEKNRRLGVDVTAMDDRSPMEVLSAMEEDWGD
ncbi:MAG: DUF4388 domain-containing protein [Planctomycetes bacterium]|nr:DUF4388 domain-containing protein [Planctomycetota bacterium]